MPITLLSDLGNNSPYVSWFISHMAHELPDHRIDILSHEIIPFRIIDAAYRWRCTLGKFPENTFHISIFDVLLSFPQHVLVKKNQNNYYIGIDNGIMTTTFDKTDDRELEIYATIDVADNFSDYINIVIKTIKTISESGIEDPYFRIHQPTVIYSFPKSIIHQNKIDCLIIGIDKQDNIITDLTYDTYLKYLKDKKYIIKLYRNDSISQITENPRYDSKGELIAYFNDFGFMQITLSSKNGKTATLLGLQAYQKESFINSYIFIEILD